MEDNQDKARVSLPGTSCGLGVALGWPLVSAPTFLFAKEPYLLELAALVLVGP